MGDKGCTYPGRLATAGGGSKGRGAYTRVQCKIPLEEMAPWLKHV